MYKLALLLVALAPTSLMASEIAVINLKMIVNKSLAAKNIAVQIEAKRSVFQEEVTKDETSLREEDKELAKQRSILSKEAFDQRAKDFRTKVVATQQRVQSKRTRLENAYVKAMASVRKSVLKIIADLSKEKGFSIAIPKSQILYSSDELEISDVVLKKLNDTLPEVKVVLEAE